MNYLVTILIAVVSLGIGFGLAWLISRRFGAKSLAKVEVQAKRIISEAEKDADMRRKEAALEIREKTLKERGELEKEMGSRRRELDAAEKLLENRRRRSRKKIDVIEGKDKELGKPRQGFSDQGKGKELAENELQQVLKKQNEQLQRIAQMTPEEAKQQLYDNMTAEAKLQAAQFVKDAKREGRARRDKEAKEIFSVLSIAVPLITRSKLPCQWCHCPATK